MRHYLIHQPVAQFSLRLYLENVELGIKGAVCGHRSTHSAGECVLLKPEEYHLFLPSPMHVRPRHGPRATSSDG